MKVVQYDTIRIKREFDVDGSVEPRQYVREIIEGQDDVDRMDSVTSHLQTDVANSFVTSVVVFDNEGKEVARGSVTNEVGSESVIRVGGGMEVTPEVKDGELTLN